MPLGLQRSTEIDNPQLAFQNSVKNLEREVELLKKRLEEKDNKIADLKSSFTKQTNVLNEKRNTKVKELQNIIKSKNKKINNLHSKINKNEKASKFLEDFEKLNEPVLEFFNMQINHIKQKKWTTNEKQFALSLFYKSPKAYCYLRDQKKFALPCVSKIRRWVNELDLSPGKCDNLLQLLKIKTENMTVKERESVLIWDEMSIKSWLEYNTKKDIVEGYTDMGELGRCNTHGNHVLVFMLRGRQHDWRQPVSYYISHNSVNGKQLHQLITENLNYAKEAGFIVKSMVCDLGAPNQSTIKKFNITKEKPFIERDGEKIFFNFDSPHLIKCLRNNFRLHKMQVGNDIVSWDAITELREREKSLPSKSAPKLTDKHLHPNSFELMNVRLAVQIFSNSVSSALLAGAFAKENPFSNPHSVTTANFLKKVNDLFDCLNSRSGNDKNPLRRPLSDKNPQVVEYLKNSLNFIKSWNCMDKKGNPPCFEGFYLTVNSILLQWEEISNKSGLYLLTSRLNQDPLENLFAVLRSRCGHNQNPTAMQLRRNLQYTITANLTSVSKLTNCKPDETVALLTTFSQKKKESMENTNDMSSGLNCDMNGSDSAYIENSNNFITPCDNSFAEDVNTYFEKECTVPCMDDSFESTASDKSFKGMVDESMELEKNANVADAELNNSSTDILDDFFSSQEIPDVNSLNNQSEKISSILSNPSDSFTPLHGAIKYVAGYMAMKCVSKFNCDVCKISFIRDNSNFEQNNDLLIFFKAYKVFGVSNELGNLCVPSDFFTDVISTAIEVFDNSFSSISSCRNVGELLKNKIITEINKNHVDYFNIEESCKPHREYVVSFFVRVHIFYKLKWMNADARDNRRVRKSTFVSDKPNRKLQKLRHE